MTIVLRPQSPYAPSSSPCAVADCASSPGSPNSSASAPGAREVLSCMAYRTWPVGQGNEGRLRGREQGC
eukprot:6702507-Pyramimonas_sp.AAC.1